MGNVKTLGIGGLVGLVLGVGVAEWLDNPNTAAYLSVVSFGVLVGGVLGKAVGGRMGPPKT